MKNLEILSLLNALVLMGLMGRDFVAAVGGSCTVFSLSLRAHVFLNALYLSD